MGPVPPEHMHSDVPADRAPPHSARWWAALRRVVARVLDAAEEVARTDPLFRNDLAAVFDSWPGGALGSGAGSADAGEGRDGTGPDDDIQAVSEGTGIADSAEVTAAEALEGPAAAPPPALFSSTKPPHAAAAAVLAVTADPMPTPSAAPAPPVAEPLPPLTGPREVSTSRGAAVAEFARGAAWVATAPFDPAGAAARLRLKAEACRWQAERRQRLDEGADVSDEDRALVSRGRDRGVWFWMVSPYKWREKSDEAFLTVAASYDALAEAAEAMALADRARCEQESAMKLLAEAQSALRAAVEDYASTRRDEDQEAAFAWLRRETDARRVFVQYLQLEHPASPDNHADLRRRIADVRRAIDERANRSRRVDQLIRKVRYSAEKLAEAAEAGGPVDAGDGHVRSIATTVEALLDAGLPPTDPRLREALLEAAPRIPADVPGPLSRVLEEANAFLDESEASQDADTAREGPELAAEAEDALVADARRRVEGLRAVMLGGRPNEPARLKLVRGLGLEVLEWLRVEHHEPFDAAEVAITRPGVGLVIILTRWRSHRDGPAARALCRDRRIPLVEQPAG